MKRTEDSLRDMWDNNKRTNIQIIGVPEEEEKKKVYGKIFEEISPNGAGCYITNISNLCLPI